VAGSGGYYIAMSADRIFVDPMTVTGSIGVVGLKPVAGPLYDKIDASYDTVKRGDHADMWSATRHLTEEELQIVQDAIDWMYDLFIDRVAEHRGLPRERVEELAQGRVYTGNQAVENGLADELGGLHEALDHACRVVGVEREDAAIVHYRERGSFVDWVMSEVAMKLRLHRLFDMQTGGFSDAVGFRMEDGFLE